MVYRCLFEQSGHFKNVFRKYGYQSYDYDIENRFGETDFVIDLFREIDESYDTGKPLLGFGKEDYVLAFFPCTRFSVQFQMNLLGNNCADLRKGPKGLHTLEKSIKLHGELHEYYSRFCKLAILAFRDGFKLVVENPYHCSYLLRYFPIEPSVVIENRRELGDYYAKPTMFYFLNCEPAYNFFFEPIGYHPTKRIAEEHGIGRSLISDDFCDRFIREYIFDVHIDEKPRSIFEDDAHERP